MPHLIAGKKVIDAAELCQLLVKNRVNGALVTPGAGVNVNVGPGYGKVLGVDVKVSGATNLATAAAAVAGHTIRYAICVDNAGTVTAVAGAEAVTGAQVAPTIDESTKTVIATVDVANGDLAVLQASIDNSARNWL